MILPKYKGNLNTYFIQRLYFGRSLPGNLVSLFILFFCVIIVTLLYHLSYYPALRAGPNPRLQSHLPFAFILVYSCIRPLGRIFQATPITMTFGVDSFERNLLSSSTNYSYISLFSPGPSGRSCPRHILIYPLAFIPVYSCIRPLGRIFQATPITIIFGVDSFERKLHRNIHISHSNHVLH